MGKSKIITKLNQTVGKAGLQLKKYSPEILVTVGIVGGVVGAVMACKATTKVSAILESTKSQVDDIHHVVENADKYVSEEHPEKYTEEQAKKDLAIVYAKTGLELVKVYAPAVAVGALAITCVLSGHNILRKRYVATAAAYTVLDKTFKDYRGRVIERFGKELDRELRYNIKTQEVEEIIVNDDGSETTVVKTVEAVDPNTISAYARFFDETCRGWERNANLNLLFLRKVQDYANDRLKAVGHLFLNEVYDELGMPRDGVGAVVGWIYDPKDSTRDNFVDFGIYDLNNPDKRAFVNGHEKSILLEFNVDGVIYDLI